MALPWVRLDANIATHDKIVHLLSDPSPKRWQAAASYMFALAWSGGQGTDGLVPAAALPFVHGTTATARLLEKYHLWEPALTGWMIRNFDIRQELTIVAEGKRAAQKLGGVIVSKIERACDLWENKEAAGVRPPTASPPAGLAVSSHEVGGT